MLVGSPVSKIPEFQICGQSFLSNQMQHLKFTREEERLCNQANKVETAELGKHRERERDDLLPEHRGVIELGEMHVWNLIITLTSIYV